MGILRTYLKDCVKKSMKNNVRCRVIGRKDELSQDIIDSINNLEEKTKNNTGLNFTIAINYGGRDEITRAVRKIAGNILKGALNAIKDEGELDHICLMKPYSFVLVDDDKETVSELLLVDDEDTMLLDDELLKGLDEELDAFLKDLLEK